MAASGVVGRLSSPLSYRVALRQQTMSDCMPKKHAWRRWKTKSRNAATHKATEKNATYTLSKETRRRKFALWGIVANQNHRNELLRATAAIAGYHTMRNTCRALYSFWKAHSRRRITVLLIQTRILGYLRHSALKQLQLNARRQWKAKLRLRSKTTVFGYFPLRQNFKKLVQQTRYACQQNLESVKTYNVAGEYKKRKVLAHALSKLCYSARVDALSEAHMHRMALHKIRHLVARHILKVSIRLWARRVRSQSYDTSVRSERIYFRHWRRCAWRHWLSTATHELTSVKNQLHHRHVLSGHTSRDLQTLVSTPSKVKSTIKRKSTGIRLMPSLVVKHAPTSYKEIHSASCARTRNSQISTNAFASNPVRVYHHASPTPSKSKTPGCSRRRTRKSFRHEECAALPAVDVLCESPNAVHPQPQPHKIGVTLHHDVKESHDVFERVSNIPPKTIVIALKQSKRKVLTCFALWRAIIIKRLQLMSMVAIFSRRRASRLTRDAFNQFMSSIAFLYFRPKLKTKSWVFNMQLNNASRTVRSNRQKNCLRHAIQRLSEHGNTTALLKARVNARDIRKHSVAVSSALSARRAARVEAEAIRRRRLSSSQRRDEARNFPTISRYTESLIAENRFAENLFADRRAMDASRTSALSTEMQRFRQVLATAGGEVPVAPSLQDDLAHFQWLLLEASPQKRSARMYPISDPATKQY